MAMIKCTSDVLNPILLLFYFLFSIFLMLLLLVSSEFSCFDKIQTQPQGGFKFNMKQMVFAYGRYLYRDGLIVQGKGY